MAKSSRTKKGSPGEGSEHRLDEAFIQQVRSQLLAWYRQNRRDLPWRSETPNPYHVMLSETMLQQTQVATVIGYYHRFLAEFPTIQDLAAASEQQVLALWQGLGYYSRARGLHAAARMIVSDFGGQVPRTVEDLLKLPGIGPYSAGAIASIAFDEPAPIVDGNVARVLARLRAIDEPVNSRIVKQWLWAMAEALVPPEAAGDFNQAMMELGALICTPRKAKCLVCPLHDLCEARKRGLTQAIPVSEPRKQPMRVDHHILVVESRGELYFEQRAAQGMWANMWQAPVMEEPTLPENETDQMIVLSHWLKTNRGLVVRDLECKGTFSHLTTHRRFFFTVWFGTLKGRRPPASTMHAWRNANNLSDLPLSKAQKIVMKMIGFHYWGCSCAHDGIIYD